MSKPYYEPKCKVCRCPERYYFEKLYTEGKTSFCEMSRIAKEKGYNISWLSFARHMKKHFSWTVQKYLESEKSVKDAVQTKLDETINIIDKIQKNLRDIEAVLEKARELKPTPASLSSLASIYRVHLQTLEFCEKLIQKLKMQVGLSREEMIREIVYACQDLPPEYLSKVSDRIRKRLDLLGVTRTI